MKYYIGVFRGKRKLVRVLETQQESPEKLYLGNKHWDWFEITDFVDSHRLISPEAFTMVHGNSLSKTASYALTFMKNHSTYDVKVYGE